MGFDNNTANPIFQFNNFGSKFGDKSSEIPSALFPSTSYKILAFGASALQNFKDNQAFQLNTKKMKK